MPADQKNTILNETAHGNPPDDGVAERGARAGRGAEDAGPVIKPQPLPSFPQVTDTAPVPSEGKGFSNRTSERTRPESGLTAKERRSQTAVLRGQLFHATPGPQLIFKSPF